MTAAAIDRLKADLRRDRIAALRYLVFLNCERAALLAELFPTKRKGDPYFSPLDDLVFDVCDASPLERAAVVLRSVGVDPHADAPWVKFMDLDPSRLPECEPPKPRRRRGGRP